MERQDLVFPGVLGDVQKASLICVPSRNLHQQQVLVPIAQPASSVQSKASQLRPQSSVAVSNVSLIPVRKKIEVAEHENISTGTKPSKHLFLINLPQRTPLAQTYASSENSVAVHLKTIQKNVITQQNFFSDLKKGGKVIILKRPVQSSAGATTTAAKLDSPSVRSKAASNEQKRVLSANQPLCSNFNLLKPTNDHYPPLKLLTKEESDPTLVAEQYFTKNFLLAKQSCGINPPQDRELLEARKKLKDAKQGFFETDIQTVSKSVTEAVNNLEEKNVQSIDNLDSSFESDEHQFQLPSDSDGPQSVGSDFLASDISDNEFPMENSVFQSKSSHYSLNASTSREAKKKAQKQRAVHSALDFENLDPALNPKNTFPSSDSKDSNFEPKKRNFVKVKPKKDQPQERNCLSSSSELEDYDSDFEPKKKTVIRRESNPSKGVRTYNVNNNKSVDAETKLLKILPQNYKYIVISAVAKNDRFNNIVGKIRVNITTAKDAVKWVNDFELCSNSNFRILKTWNTEWSKRVAYKKILRCHHDTLAEKSGTKNPHEKHTRCPARLTITVKSQSMKWSQDLFLKSHPCEVTVKHIHNHDTEGAFGDILRHRRPCQEVVDSFTKMFTDLKARITPAQAMQLHLSKLEQEDEDLFKVGDGAHCPEMKWVYKLYNKVMKDLCGDAYGPKMIEALQASVDRFNTDCGELCAKLGTTSDGRSHFVVVCTPMMKRVLTHHKASGEIMFIDSSGSMDGCNARVFVMVAPSPVCGLPEGLLITFSETEGVITEALQLWKQIIPKEAFYGRGLDGPKIIMSDDSKSLRNALGGCFPLAFLLLCLFHILQAMWRYIWDSKHRVKAEHRPHVYYLFTQIACAGTEEDFNRRYEEALSDPILKSYPDLWEHMVGLRARSHEWALCMRRGLITRGHNTNNYCEAIMRILKSLILCRLRAYNTVQLFHILCEDVETHFKRKLAFVINNRVKSLRSRLRVAPAKLKPLVATKLFDSDHLFEVKNSEKNTFYYVDTKLEICSCPVGMCGAPCKHQLAVVRTFKVSHQQFLPTNDAAFKMSLYYIMTGKSSAPDGFFNTLKGGDEIVNPIVPEEAVNSSSQGDLVEQSSHKTIATDVNSAAIKNDLLDLVEDLCRRLSQSPDFLADPIEKFKKSYWTIANRNDSDSMLASALATFGKDQSGLKPAPSHLRKATINVQPTSIARRTVFKGGRNSHEGGRPRKGVSGEDHAYGKAIKKKADSNIPQSWAQPPKKTCKVPHSLSQCVEANHQLPK